VLFANHGALVFRGVADVTLRQGSTVPGGLWWITPDCEAALDKAEGVGIKGWYAKRSFRVERQGRLVRVLFYQLGISRGILPPSEEYLERVREGYRDFGLDPEPLERALERAWADKLPTKRLMERHIRKGRPTLARPLSFSGLRPSGGTYH
jgi:hypothetical protein